MKKFLSLMLAMIMVMSLVTVGAGAADFTDEEKIQYNEAVAVMSELGILGGYSDDSFRPQNPLTRQVAAKIIAYIALGADDAEDLICVESPFTDVPATKTLAPYINWFAQKGYVTGYDDGSFKPEANVSGHAFLKMVLGALGIEGTYEGTGWRLNVTTNAAEAGLFDGIDTNAIDLTKDATRELACQIAFNAMFYSEEETVTEYIVWVDGEDDPNNEYNKAVDELLYQGTDITTAALLKMGNEDALLKTVDVTPGSFAKENFKMEMTEPADGGRDTYGRPATVYSVDGEDTVYAIEKPVLTYTSSKTEKALFADLGKAGYQGSDDKFVLIQELWIDGEMSYEGATASKEDGKYTFTEGATAIEKNAASTATFGGNGTITEIYATSKGNEFIAVQTNEYLGKVASVIKADEEKGDARKIVVTLYVGDSADAGYEFETEEFAKNNMVLVTLKDSEIDTVKLAKETKNVAVDKYASSNVTIAGETLKYSAKHTTNGTYLTKGDYDFDLTYSYITDSQGNVIAIKEYSASVNNYAYVTSIQAQEYDEDDLLGTGAEALAVAEVIFTDGTKKVVDLKITKASDAEEVEEGQTPAYQKGDYIYDQPQDNGTIKTIEVADIEEADSINNWFAYKANEDGTYTLVALADSASSPKVAVYTDEDDELNLAKGIAMNIDEEEDIWTSSKTVVYSIDEEGAVTKATGLVKADLDAADKKVLYVWDSDLNVTAIYAVDQETIIEAAASDYVYAISKGATLKGGVEWKFAEDGEEKTYVISNADVVAKGNIYKLSTANEKVVASKITDNVVIVTVARVDDAYILDTDGNVYYLTDTTAVYNVDSGKGAADELEKDDVITLLKTADDEIVVAYITAEAEA